LQHGLRTVGFCGISTGVYGYPKDAAAELVLHFVRRWLEDPAHRAAIDRIIFVQYHESEAAIYTQLMPLFFPEPSPALAATQTDPDFDADAWAASLPSVPATPPSH
jgi:hypothetical protein